MGKHEGTKQRRWERWTEAEARQELKAYPSSGKTLAAFARDRGVAPQRLYWWRKRLGERPRRSDPEVSTNLVPAVVKAPIGTLFSTAAVLVHAPGGMVVEISVPAAVSPEWAAAFVSGLARPPR